MNNTVIFSCGNDFAAGTCKSLVPAAGIGRGALVLAPEAVEGEFVSPVLAMDDFSTVVMSWNTDLPEGTVSEAFCRAQAEDGQWSQWLSWGQWSPFIRRASLNETCGGVASVETDTLSMNDGHVGKAVQLKCVLRRTRAGCGDPVLRLLAATARLSREDRLPNVEPKCSVDNTAPAYCQGIRDPNIGFGMCSPTTATVLMNALGGDLLPEESAMACWDHTYEGHGNWAFTMAMAGSFGYETWLSFGNADTLRQALKQGPVGVNAAYSNTPERATEHAPYVENTPGYTAGHLLTARGLELDAEGREWLLVNDSYGNPDSQARRRYPLDQFVKAWSGMMYMVRPKLPGAGSGSPYRVPAKLKKTDFGDEFLLEVNGQDMPLDPHFNGGRRCCTGIVAYYVDDAYNYETTANRPFHYTKVTVNGNLFIPARALLRSSTLGDRAAINVFVINDRGVTYTARLTQADL